MITTAWPMLPEPIRRAVMALVESVTGITTTKTDTDGYAREGFGDGDTV